MLGGDAIALGGGASMEFMEHRNSRDYDSALITYSRTLEREY